jgi:hypothetical protein
VDKPQARPSRDQWQDDREDAANNIREFDWNRVCNIGLD